MAGVVPIPQVLTSLALKIGQEPHHGRPFIVGLTGGVASGKSVFAVDLANALRKLAASAKVEVVSTDSFLFANAALIEKGLLARKGFPETYDRNGMVSFIEAIRLGNACLPFYSHEKYDIDKNLTRTISVPDILILEGLGLDDKVPLDRIIYIDASIELQENWYVSRFLEFWQQAKIDPNSFYVRFIELDRNSVETLASRVWRDVNLPNLIRHIEPVRNYADFVVHKGENHTVESIGTRQHF